MTASLTPHRATIISESPHLSPLPPPAVKGEGEEDPDRHAPTATPAPICSMMASAKALHFSKVASSIRRSKSYVTVFTPMAPSMPWMMRSGAGMNSQNGP